MAIPTKLYNKDGKKVWDFNTSKRNLNIQKMGVDVIDRDLFLGTQGEYKKFTTLMDIHQFDCTHPFQVRIMGNMDDVRDVSKKILTLLEKHWEGKEEVKDCRKDEKKLKKNLKCNPFGKDNPLKKKGEGILYDQDQNKIMTYTSGAIGLSKLECDKKERTNRYCGNTIRAYINPFKDKPTCTPKK